MELIRRFALGGPDDTDGGSNPRGRWIPTTSVEQYAATLATWYGLSCADLSAVFPLIGRFRYFEPRISCRNRWPQKGTKAQTCVNALFVLSGNSLWLIRLIVFAVSAGWLCRFSFDAQRGHASRARFLCWIHPRVTRARRRKSPRRALNVTCRLMRARARYRSPLRKPTFPDKPIRSPSRTRMPIQTRLRWGFELTVLDTASDEKAGELQSTTGLTQVLNCCEVPRVNTLNTSSPVRLAR